jgi:hypothetical protein
MMPKTPRHIRVFLSSPGDVKEERDAADRILEGLPRGHAWKGKFTIDPVRWDDPYAPATMDAHLTPQEAVNRNLSKPSQCNVVVVILWGRMGTPLPKSYKKPDGTLYLSGTEWEFEDAQAADRRILLYRRTEKPRPDIDDPDFAEKRKQYQLVQQFFERFKAPDGSQTVSYTPSNGRGVQGALQEGHRGVTAAVGRRGTRAWWSWQGGQGHGGSRHASLPRLAQVRVRRRGVPRDASAARTGRAFKPYLCASHYT